MPVCVCGHGRSRERGREFDTDLLLLYTLPSSIDVRVDIIINGGTMLSHCCQCKLSEAQIRRYNMLALALFNVQPTGCSSPTVSGLAPHSPAAVPLDISVGSGGDVKVKLVSPNRCGGGRERQSVVMRSPLKTPLRFSHRRKNSGVMYPSSPGNGGQLNLRQRSASAVEIRSPRSPLALQMLQYDDQHVLVLENSQMKHIARSLNVSMDQVASVYAGLKSAPRREGGDVPDLALPTTRNGEARSHAVRNLRAELIDME
jgi:hypothetical protein